MGRIRLVHAVIALLAFGFAAETAYLVHYTRTSDKKVAEFEEKILGLEFALMEPEAPVAAAPAEPKPLNEMEALGWVRYEPPPPPLPVAPYVHPKRTHTFPESE